MKTGDPFLIWVWARHSAISGWIWRLEDQRRGGREQGQEQGEQPADNTLHKQLLTASPNWFRTLFLRRRRRRRRTNRTERRQETMPDAASNRCGERCQKSALPVRRSSKMASNDLSSPARMCSVCQDACSCSPDKKVNKRRHVHCC